MVARVLAGRVPSSLDSLLGVKDELLDRELVLRGKFADEIARLEKARADAAEKLGMIETVEQAATVRREAEAAAERLRAETGFKYNEAAGVLASAVAKKKAADDQEARIAEREAAIATNARNLEAAATALEAREEALKAATQANERSVNERTAALSNLAKELTVKAGLIAEREKRVNSRLEALKLTPE